VGDAGAAEAVVPAAGTVASAAVAAVSDEAADEAVAAPAQEAVPWTPPSWDQVVREHSARVYRLAYRLTGNVPDAEDLI